MLGCVVYVIASVVCVVMLLFVRLRCALCCARCVSAWYIVACVAFVVRRVEVMSAFLRSSSSCSGYVVVVGVYVSGALCVLQRVFARDVCVSV